MNKMLQKAVISYLEFYSDGATDLHENKAHHEFTLRQYYRCTNNSGQNVLHIIAKKCNLALLNFVLDVLETKEVHRIINEQDDEGNTPLMIACLYGSKDLHLENEKSIQLFWKERFEFFREMVDVAGADLEVGLVDRRMNHLHWAFYFGDVQTGMLLFKKCPKLLFLTDEEDQTPLELASQIVFKPMLKKSSINLARSCINYLIETLKQSEYKISSLLSKIHLSAAELQEMISPSKSVNSTSRLMKKNNQVSPLPSIELSKFATKKVGLPNVDPLKITNENINLNNDKLVNTYDSDSKEKQVVKVISISSRRNEENEFVRILNLYACVEVYAYNYALKSKTRSQNRERLTSIIKSNSNKQLPPMPEKSMERIVELICEFGINPFVRSLDDRSPFEHAIALNLPTIIDQLSNFEFVEKDGTKLELKTIVNSKNINGETPLHLASYNNSKEVYDKLINEFEAVPTYDNYYFLPEENTQDEKFVSNNLTFHTKKNMIENLNTVEGILEYLKKNIKHDHIECPYAIAFVFSSEKDASLVENQWTSFSPYSISSWFDENAEDGRESLIFISHPYDKYPMVAQHLKLSMFNKEKGYIDQYDVNNVSHFTKFRDFHKHKLLLYLLNIEVNIEVYSSNSIIEEVIFLHDFKTRRKLKDQWEKEKWGTLLDPIYRAKKSKRSWPFAGISFYFGTDYGLCLSFVSLYTAYLTLLGIMSLFFTFWIIFHNKDFDSSVDPIFGIIISIWVTLMVQMWMRRESECVMAWRTINTTKYELDLPSYRGNFSVDATTNLINKKDPISLDTRKLITFLPVYTFGLILIAINFYVFTALSNLVDNSELDDVWKIVIGSIIGFVNGVANNLFQWAFELVVEKAIEFENHQRESSKENSTLLKLFVYNFILNYINTFYYLFFEDNFSVFSVNFISTVISNDIYYFIEQRLVPWFTYLGKKKKLMSDIKESRKAEVQEYLKKANLIAHSKTTSQRIKPLSEFLDEVIIQEQLQMNLIMRDSIDTKDIMFQYTAQLGYIAFFALSFPPAVIWCVFFNIVDLLFVTWSFVDHTKRKQCLEVSTLGFWNTALSAMCFIAITFNIVVLMFGSQSCYRLMNLDNDDDASKWKVYVALFTAENILFIVVYLIFTLVDQKPKWVREKIQEEELIRERDLKIQLRKAAWKLNHNHNMPHEDSREYNPDSQEVLPNTNVYDDKKNEEAPSFN